MDALLGVMDTLKQEMERVKVAQVVSESCSGIAEQIQTEKQLREQLDAACARWVLRRNWSDEKPENIKILSERIGEAYEFARWLTAAGFHFPGDPNQLLRFLLIEHWKNFAVIRWESVLQGKS